MCLQGPLNVLLFDRQIYIYTQSHIKSDQPGSHVFRWFLGQLSTDFYEIILTES